MMELCRALSGHAWRIEGPIVVLKNNARRIVLYCPRCKAHRVDRWSSRGGILGRTYDRTEEYAAFIKGHSNQDARGVLLGETKNVEDNHPRLRLVQGKGRARHRKSNAQQRASRGHANA